MPTQAAQAPEVQDEARVAIFIPRQEDPTGKLDQTEHVTITNRGDSKTYIIQRGEHVDVPVAVFEQLKNKYPNL